MSDDTMVIMTMTLDKQTGELTLDSPPREEMVKIFEDVETRVKEGLWANRDKNRSGLALILSIAYHLEARMKAEALAQAVSCLKEVGLDVEVMHAPKRKGPNGESIH